MAKHSFRKFNNTFMTMSFLAVCTISLFNLTIDPLGVIGSPSIAGVNAIKPKTLNNSRLFKAVDMARIRPKSILLGSSRTDIGLDPSHPALIQPAYNLGLTAPNIYELRRYFEHALTIQPELEQVVIGLDFQMFNDLRTPQPDFRDQRLGHVGIIGSDLLDVTLSLDALSASWETLLRNRNPNLPRSVRVNGMMVRKPGEVDLRVFFETIARAQRQYQDGVYKGFSSYENSLTHLEAIVETCADRGIQLFLFISPAHATEWESIYNLGLWPLFEQWKRDIVGLHPVWDFSGYNSVTSEVISPGMIYYTDSSHYTPSAGQLVLNRIFNHQLESVPYDFGRYLIPEMLTFHQEAIANERLIWHEKQPDLARVVADIKRYEETRYAEEVYPLNLATIMQAQIVSEEPLLHP
ncbi:hypothetical protein [Thermostichus vulcanus]|uniref:SGNH/GDSL hydrolase family protein n=1 Tax=Thermostichus vulcanus str. 'Rupite' TaxID=2813851 RepID=A0ABT0C7I8_THEVL|nr:hypothetical protein [Thermostichus vulcanus]MCJ2541345.1 hypothetical protein [Thermostichus vulcanus str. 'Rupite']